MNENENQNVPEPLEYDGIREDQNQLPRWWLWMFVCTVIFAAGYFVYFNFGPGLSIQQDLQNAQKEYDAKHPKNLNAVATEEEFARLVKDQVALADGKKIFAERCVICHGAEGQGQIGPNLTDNFWIHGNGTAIAISDVVKNGFPPKGMPPWGTILSNPDIAKVSAYVRSLRGTNPAGAKAPQGEEIKE